MKTIKLEVLKVGQKGDEGVYMHPFDQYELIKDAIEHVCQHWYEQSNKAAPHLRALTTAASQACTTLGLEAWAKVKRTKTGATIRATKEVADFIAACLFAYALKSNVPSACRETGLFIRNQTED